MVDAAEQALGLAKEMGADEADVLVSHETALSYSCRLGKPEHSERAESRGLGLRVLVADKEGYRQALVSMGSWEKPDVKTAAERAVAMARAAPTDPYAGLAEEGQLFKEERVPDLELFDPLGEPSLDWCRTQAETAEEAARAVEGVTNSDGAEASYGCSKSLLATSQGFMQGTEESHYGLSCAVLAGEGGGMETDYAYRSTCFAQDLPAPETVGVEAATRAVARLAPRKIKSGSFPVLFEPRTARSLVGIFASAVNGEAVARGSSFLSEAMGEVICPAGVGIYDDPLRKRGLRSQWFDGEGVACAKRALLDEEGRLQTWLLDSRSARRLGQSSTGHAARGLASPPSPSATNLYMAAGTLSKDALMAEMGQGLLITDLFGMGVNKVTGDYSQGAAGFWVEQGQIAYPVHEITIASHLRTMLQTITPANDLAFDYGINAPTLRVEQMTIAGS